MDNTWIVNLAASTGVATVIVTGINALVQRRKLGAESTELDAKATDIITGAAARVVALLETKNAGLEKEIEEYKADVEVVKKFIIAHRTWDVAAMKEVNRLQGHLVPPPAIPPEWSDLWDL